nr:hypothetical protein [Paraburkholderia acidisoli]
MFVVYWCEMSADGGRVPHMESFAAGGMSEALAFAETLRRRQAQDRSVGFVTLCSENPASVGPAGAAEPPPDYDWKKRRR